MKKILLVLLSILMLAPVIAYAKDEDPTVDQYAKGFAKIEAEVTDNAEETYKVFLKWLKLKERPMETQPIPDGTEVQFYPLDEAHSGVYGTMEGKTLAYEIKDMTANSVKGYLKVVEITPPGQFLDLLATPSAYSTKSVFTKGKKAGAILSTFYTKDAKGKPKYNYSLVIVKDLDFYDKMKALYEAENKE